jgi:hypothetical protein
MNPEDERYAAQLLEKMKQQNAAMMGGQGLPNRQPEMVGGGSIPDQSILQSVSQSKPPTPAQGAFDVCPQCGVMHPPLSPGQKCPVSKVEVKEAGVTEDDIVRFTVNMRDIAISQIEKKKIKEGNKLFKYLTIEFMKLLEGYKE